MTKHDITELTWLAGVLRSTASRLERAAGLLSLAGDLDSIAARLALLKPPETGTSAITGRDPSPAVAPPAAPGRGTVRLPPVGTSERSTEICAVFDGSKEALRKNAKNTESKPKALVSGKTRPW